MWVIAYAGKGCMGVANQMADRLREAGCRLQILPIERVRIELLHQNQYVLFITGGWRGDEPSEHALNCLRDLLESRRVLTGVRYGLLALGDDQAGGLGHLNQRLVNWIESHGANSMFPMVESGEQGQSVAIAQWQAAVNPWLEQSLCGSAAGDGFLVWLWRCVRVHLGLGRKVTPPAGREASCCVRKGTPCVCGRVGPLS